MATQGYDRYRYKGPYGGLTIGANSTAEALSEAKRFLDKGAEPDVGLLEMWDGEAWIAAIPPVSAAQPARRYGVFPGFGYLCSGNNEEWLHGLTLCSAIDPISGERTITLYTDDGRGNGDGVLILVDPGIVKDVDFLLSAQVQA